jgi:hypothetical protein
MELAIYANVVLPVIIVAIGYAAMRWHLHQASKGN